jgi:hypothetical protein
MSSTNFYNISKEEIKEKNILGTTQIHRKFIIQEIKKMIVHSNTQWIQLTSIVKGEIWEFFFETPLTKDNVFNKHKK